MQRVFFRLLILSMLLLSVVLPTTLFAQDTPTVTVTPDAGVVGSGIFEVKASGLVEGDSYTVEFVINGIVVYESLEEADADGEIVFSAASTPDDEIGVYTVQIISNDNIIASTTLEIIDESDNTRGDDDTSTTESIGNLSVTPDSGPISTVHTIAIRDLEPDRGHTVEITASETDEVVYRRIWTSSETGSIDIEIFAEDGDTPGTQVIRVFDNDGNIVAQGDFFIEAPPTRNATVTVSPQAAPAGREFTITVDGLASFDSVSVQITSDDNTLIDTLLARASSEGVAVLSFVSDSELAEDTYNLAVFVDGERLQDASLTIGEADVVETTDTEDSDSSASSSDSDVSLVVDPEFAPLGSVHALSIAGLEANQPFTLTISDSDGEVEYATTRTADDNGDFSINISSTDEDEIGLYTIEISDATTGQVLTAGEMLLTETSSSGDSDETSTDASDNAQTSRASISVDPQSGEIGATHSITLSGMPANERIGVTIRYVSDNTLAQSSVVVIDDAGSGSMSFTSRELNTPGEYKVMAIQPDGTVIEATFTIEGALATIEPQAGALGSTHTITVTGLNANETVTFDVMFAGESVYTTESTADAEGIATLALTTESSDEVGDYTIMVDRESGNEPSVILTATAEDDTTTTEESSDSTADASTSDSASDTMVFEGNLPSDGVASFEFDGNEGEYILVQVESDDFDTSATIYDADFFQIGYNDDSLGTTNSLLGPLKLPYTGTYSLEVSSFYAEDAIEGAFTASVSMVSVETISFNEPIPFVLDEATSTAFFELPVVAGDNLNISADTGGTIDTVMRVLYPDSYEFAYDDDSGAGFEAELNNLIFEFDDTYILAVSSFTAGVSGEGVLLVERNPVKSLDEGTVTVTLNDKAYRDLVVFDALEGQLVTLNLEKLSGSVEDLYVYANVDGMQIMSYTTMGVPDNLPLTFVMPMDGRVIVTLEEFGFGSGITFDVSVTKE
jgi:hypothetical protein